MSKRLIAQVQAGIAGRRKVIRRLHAHEGLSHFVRTLLDFQRRDIELLKAVQHAG